jgi:hypothetical protein
MPFGFGKKDRDGHAGKGKGIGRRFRLGRKRVSPEIEQQNIKCICPECDPSAPHQQGMPCFELRCPQCGSKMTRRF